MEIACSDTISEDIPWVILKRSVTDRGHHFMKSNPAMYAWAFGDFTQADGRAKVIVSKWSVPSDFTCPSGRAVGRWIWKVGNTCNDAGNLGIDTESFSMDEYKSVVNAFKSGQNVQGQCLSESPEQFVSCFVFTAGQPSQLSPSPTSAGIPSSAQSSGNGSSNLSSQQPTSRETQPTAAPTEGPSKAKRICVSNHATIDYTVACQALTETCEQFSFCKLVSSEVERATPMPTEDQRPGNGQDPEPEPENEVETNQSDPEPESEPEHDVDRGTTSQPTRCVPVGNCDAFEWCDQEQYEAWCYAQAQTTGCPLVFCKTEPSLVQHPVKRHLRKSKQHAFQTGGLTLYQAKRELSELASLAERTEHRSEEL